VDTRRVLLLIAWNFNNFVCVCHSLAACQEHILSLAAVIGLSNNNNVVSLRSLSRVSSQGNDKLTWRTQSWEMCSVHRVFVVVICPLSSHLRCPLLSQASECYLDGM